MTKDVYTTKEFVRDFYNEFKDLTTLNIFTAREIKDKIKPELKTQSIFVHLQRLISPKNKRVIFIDNKPRFLLKYENKKWLMINFNFIEDLLDKNSKLKYDLLKEVSYWYN